MSTTAHDRHVHEFERARRRPIGQLLGDFAEDASRLVGHELELARAEVTEQVDKAKAASAMFGAAAVAGLAALGALTACAILALALVVDGWLAALIVGGALAVIAIALALVGRSRMRAVSPPVPDRALKSVREDVAAVQDGVQAGRESNGGGHTHGA